MLGKLLDYYITKTRIFTLKFYTKIIYKKNSTFVKKTLQKVFFIVLLTE